MSYELRTWKNCNDTIEAKLMDNSGALVAHLVEHPDIEADIPRRGVFYLRAFGLSGGRHSSHGPNTAYETAVESEGVSLYEFRAFNRGGDRTEVRYTSFDRPSGPQPEYELMSNIERFLDDGELIPMKPVSDSDHEALKEISWTVEANAGLQHPKSETKPGLSPVEPGANI